MGVDFADIDRDGRMDALIVEMLSRDPATRLRQMPPDKPGQVVLGGLEQRPQTGRNTLLWNRGDGTFAEIAHYAGLAVSDWSWSPVFLDVDLGGFEDVLITNGQLYDWLDEDARERGERGDERLVGRTSLKYHRIETP